MKIRITPSPLVPNYIAQLIDDLNQVTFSGNGGTPEEALKELGKKVQANADIREADYMRAKRGADLVESAVNSSSWKAFAWEVEE